MFDFFKARAESPYQRLEHFNPDHAQYFVVNWCLGNVCNYSCTYCPEGLHDGSNPWADLEVMKKFVLKLQAHYGEKKKYFFELTGGEVTLFRDFLPLLEFLKERNCRVGIISNASRALSFWEKARPLLDQACLSFHPQAADAKHFFSIVNFMSESVRVHVNIMMDPDHFYDSYSLAIQIKDLPNISVALQPLLVNFGNEQYPYTPTQRAILENQDVLVVKPIRHTEPFESYRGAMKKITTKGSEKIAPHQLIVGKENSWKNWSCYAGVEQIAVNMDGGLFRGWCQVGGQFGRVDDDEIRFPNQPVNCTKDFCHCNFDIMSTKVSK